MPSFRWPDVSHDIALAKEAISLRPEKPADWDVIAHTLSSNFSTEDKPVFLKGRGCRERLDLLLKKFKDDDAKALKRSGTEEDYTELHQLLEDINSYMRDFNALKASQTAQKVAQQKRLEEDKRKGEEMRRSAMEGIAKRRQSSQVEERPSSSPNSPSASSLDLDYNENEDGDIKEVSIEPSTSSASPPPQKRKKFAKDKLQHVQRSSRLTAIEMLERKYEKKAQLKERELAIREKELELQKKKLEMEEEERKQKMQLELEERRAFLEILKKHLQ